MEFMIKADEIDIDDQPMPEAVPGVREALRESIKKYGIEYPLVVYKKEDGRYSIIDGRTRFSIGMELGIKEFRCLVEDTLSNPERTILKYDLELCRRRLVEEQVERLTREKEAYAEQIFGNEERLNERLKLIIPEYHGRLMELYKSNKEEALILMRRLLSLPPESQKAFLIADTDNMSNEAIKILAEEKENLRMKVEELTGEVDRLRDVEGKLSEKQEQMNSLMREYKKRFNDELNQRQKEIEENLRELYTEQDVASTAKKIEAAVSAEKIRLEKDMAADFEELNREMRGMSLNFKKTNEEIEKKKEELDKVKARLKEAEDLAVKHKNEALVYKNRLQKMVSPKNLELRVKAASDSLSTILEIVEVAQNEMFSCYDILVQNGIEKPKLAPILKEVEEKRRKIGEFLCRIGEAKEKLQEVVKN
jgi:ParB-like chromosome segregation protein Spo0J